MEKCNENILQRCMLLITVEIQGDILTELFYTLLHFFEISRIHKWNSNGTHKIFSWQKTEKFSIFLKTFEF